MSTQILGNLPALIFFDILDVMNTEAFCMDKCFSPLLKRHVLEKGIERTDRTIDHVFMEKHVSSGGEKTFEELSPHSFHRE